MATGLARFVAALICTYALSRVLLRVPMPVRGPARLLLVHGASALLLGAWVWWVRQLPTATFGILVTQAGWLLLDQARGRARGRSTVTARRD